MARRDPESVGWTTEHEMSVSSESDGSRGARRGPTEVARSVNVDYNRGGAWKVGLPDCAAPLVCETLEEAQWIAYRCAAQRSPCELLVHDAYHRLILRQVIDGEDRSGASLSSPAHARRRSVRRPSPAWGGRRADRLSRTYGRG